MHKDAVFANKISLKIRDGKINSKLRPDVAAVRADGKVDITEVLSPGQKAADLEKHYQNALGDLAGEFTAITPKKQTITGSRISR